MFLLKRDEPMSAMKKRLQIRLGLPDDVWATPPEIQQQEEKKTNTSSSHHTNGSPAKTQVRIKASKKFRISFFFFFFAIGNYRAVNTRCLASEYCRVANEADHSARERRDDSRIVTFQSRTGK